MDLSYYINDSLFRNIKLYMTTRLSHIWIVFTEIKGMVAMKYSTSKNKATYIGYQIVKALNTQISSRENYDNGTEFWWIGKGDYIKIYKYPLALMSNNNYIWIVYYSSLCETFSVKYFSNEYDAVTNVKRMIWNKGLKLAKKSTLGNNHKWEFKNGYGCIEYFINIIRRPLLD